MNASEPLSAGGKSLPNKTTSFASTQAAYRFYNNESVTLPVLQEPLTLAAQSGIIAHCTSYALCVHDWSRLAYKHANKSDRYAITHATDVGYDLQTSLIVSDSTGIPIAPVAQRLVSANGSYASYQTTNPVPEVKAHLDEVTDCIQHLEQQDFAKPLVHIIDREADSVRHMRQWSAAGALWLTRSRDRSGVEYQGRSIPCQDLANELQFEKVREVHFNDQTCWQWVAEASVRITRPTHTTANGKKIRIPGPAIEARLVVARLLCAQGNVVAQWLLLSNVSDVPASTIALWYYWRWQIECYFKLLKKAGHNLEFWQQESAPAIARRLMVASMACVTVWEIAADQSEEVAELRRFLIKLSGRQIKRGQDFTHPALLAGLWVWLAMQEVLSAYSEDELAALKKSTQQFIGGVV